MNYGRQTNNANGSTDQGNTGQENQSNQGQENN